MRLRIYLSLIVCITLISLFPSKLAQSKSFSYQTSKPSLCNGLDLVLIVSETASIQVNDDLSLRKNAVSTAIDLLGENALYFCPGFQHRIAVLGAGDINDNQDDQNYRIYIPPTTIQPSIDTIEVWTEQAYAMKKKVPENDDLGKSTNYKSAFLEAANIFKQWTQDKPIDPPGGLSRKHALIFITDGDMVNLTFGKDFKPIIDELAPIVDSNGGYLPWRGENNANSIMISVIGMFNKTSGGTPFFEIGEIKDFFNNLTQTHGGSLLYLPNIGQMSQASFINSNLIVSLAQAMNPLLGSRLVSTNCQPIWIDPYLGNLTILRLYRYNIPTGKTLDDVVITIKAVSDGKTVAQYTKGNDVDKTGVSFKYIPEGLSESYTFFRPKPGKYIVETSGTDAAEVCKDVDVQVGQTDSRIDTLSPSDNTMLTQIDRDPYYDPSNPLVFRFQFFQPDMNAKMQPLEELSDYLLDVHVVLTSPPNTNQPPQEIQLIRTNDSQAIYESKDPNTKVPLPILLRYTGTYTWKMTATTNNPRKDDPNQPDATPLVVFQASGQYSVEPLQRSISLKLVHPTQSQTIPILESATPQPILVQVQINDESNGNNLRTDLDIAEGGASPLSAVLRDPHGNPVDTEEMTRGKNNVYTSSVSFNGNGLNYSPACYTLDVELGDGYQKDIFHPTAQKTDAINICLMQAFQVNWNLKNPVETQNYPIHDLLTFFGSPKGLALQVQMLKGKNPIQAADAAQGKNALFKGTLSLNGVQKADVEFQPDNSGLFTAAWPAYLTTSGKYTLEVSPVKDELKSNYVFAAQETQVVNFSRVDGLINNPFLLPGGVGSVLLAILIAFLATGGPGGTLSFQKPESQDVVVHLSRSRLLKWKNIKRFGLNSIKVEKAPKMEVILDEGKIVKTSGVRVEMRDDRGQLFGISILYPGTQDTYSEFTLIYNKTKLKSKEY